MAYYYVPGTDTYAYKIKNPRGAFSNWITLPTPTTVIYPNNPTLVDEEWLTVSRHTFTPTDPGMSTATVDVSGSVTVRPTPQFILGDAMVIPSSFASGSVSVSGNYSMYPAYGGDGNLSLSGSVQFKDALGNVMQSTSVTYSDLDEEFTGSATAPVYYSVIPGEYGSVSVAVTGLIDNTSISNSGTVDISGCWGPSIVPPTINVMGVSGAAIPPDYYETYQNTMLVTCTVDGGGLAPSEMTVTASAEFELYSSVDTYRDVALTWIGGNLWQGNVGTSDYYYYGTHQVYVTVTANDYPDNPMIASDSSARTYVGDLSP